MKLSVVIVNYNVKYFLEQCLRSVVTAGQDMAMEVFVVDNNSVDGSVEMVKEKFPFVRLIANTVNTGFARANNQAIRASTGEYVLLLNPDTVVEEDTFRKTLAFMDEHPEAGGLGVKMIDGSGRFLPESKRGLPTPEVAFYKIFGLSVLFPKSKKFGRYHLGYLDENNVHDVDVLAGAFMLLRKSALEKTGYLDEDFFMYGEDIDLSYRLQKSGFRNYYFPETQIIHYKGESTKKSSVNYVFVFYNAMIIFARKHFSRKNASTFSFFIKLAIYLRASMALGVRLFKLLMLPALDFLLLFTAFYFLKNYWGYKVNVIYPPVYLYVAVPCYLLVWLVTVYFSGGYDQPFRFSRLIRGVLTGTLIILVVYALLPEVYRYSRALLLMGAFAATLGMTLLRLVLRAMFPKQFPLTSDALKRLLIVGDADEGVRVLSLLKMSGTQHNFIGFVLPVESAYPPSLPEYRQFLLGNIAQLKEMVDVFSANEIIFCAKDIPSHEIIQHMAAIGGKDVEFKIAPPESLFIIGSSSIDDPGELYVVDLNSISSSSNRRNKRLFDVLTSIVVVFFSPLLLLVQRNPAGLLSNCFKVLAGQLTWVGFTKNASQGDSLLPTLKPGILTPSEAFHGLSSSAAAMNRLNTLYAKDYQVIKDLFVVWKGIRNLGRKEH